MDNKPPRDLSAVEAALYDRTRQLQEILDHAPVEIYLKDLNGHHIMTSRRTRQLYGEQGWGGGGPTAQEIFRPEEAAFFEAHDHEVIACKEAIGREYELVTPDGVHRIHYCYKFPILDDSGEIAYIGAITSDITDQKNFEKRLQQAHDKLQDKTQELQEKNEQLAYQANHDKLTGLLNRAAFEKHLQGLVSETDHGSRYHVLCYLDVDQFKLVNDSVGHEAGDALLQQLAGLFQRSIRDEDILARVGGDEFILILTDKTLSQAKELAERLLSAIRAMRFNWSGRCFNVSVSIGLAPFSNHADDPGDALSCADVACLMAKDKGRNQICTYQPDDQRVNRYHTDIITAGSLKDAVAKDRFELYAQPIVSLSTPDSPPAHEILLRLREDNRLVLPESFIPAAERYGSIIDIDLWVVKTLLTRYAHWFRDGNARFTVNLSGLSLGDPRVSAHIMQMVAKARIRPAQLCFEITETAAMGDLDYTIGVLQRLRKKDYHFALDDFGCGMSSLSYLRHLPVDYIKIDGSFITHIHTDAVNRMIVQSVSDVSQALGMQTVAEGVEHRESLQILNDLKINHAQGYACGMPKPLVECRLG